MYTNNKILHLVNSSKMHMLSLLAMVGVVGLTAASCSDTITPVSSDDTRNGASLGAAAPNTTGRISATVGQTPAAPSLGQQAADGRVVKAYQVITFTAERTSPTAMMLKNITSKVFGQAAFATNTGTVTATVAPSTLFLVDNNLAIGANNGVLLALGNLYLNRIKDNSLYVCGISGTARCNSIILSLYTTSLPAPNNGIAGFVNTTSTPKYGVNITAWGNNPGTPLPLGSPGIESVRLAINPAANSFDAYPNIAFQVFADAPAMGSGSYTANIVLEYALSAAF